MIMHKAWRMAVACSVWAVLAAAAAQAAVVIPLGHWTLDDAVGATSVADSSGNGFNMTAPGAVPTLGVAGAVTGTGTASSFIATGGWAANNNTFFSAPSYAFAGWFNVNDFNTHRTLVSTRSGGGENGMVTYAVGGAFEFWARTAAGWSIQRVAVSPSTWYFVAGSYDAASGTKNFYVTQAGAGSLAAPLTATGVVQYQSSPGSLGIGCRPFDNGLPFTGKIDDVQYYGAALSQADVEWLYANPGKDLSAGPLPASMTWTGSTDPLTGSEWSTSVLTPQNWTSGGTGVDYTEGAGTLFNDSALNTTVDISWGDVNPGLVTFANTAAASYKVTGIYAIAGGTALLKKGTGTVTILNNNTYTGLTQIAAGTLEVGDGGTSGALGSGPIIDVGSLVFNRGDTFTVANVIGGAGTLTKKGAGTLNLTAANSYGGGTTVSQGTLQVANGSALGPGAVALNDANTADSSTALLATGPMTINNNLTVANQGTAATTVGTTNFTSGANTQFNGTLTLNKDVTLQAGSSDRTTFGGLITGTGSLHIASPFANNRRIVIERTSGAANSFVGDIYLGDNADLQPGVANSIGNRTIPDGTSVYFAPGSRLRFAPTGSGDGETIGALISQTPGAGTVDMFTGASFTLTVGGGDTGGAFSGVIQNSAGTLNLAKTGAGTFVMAGTNTTAGSTTINAGVFQVGDGGTKGNLASGAVVNNASLVFNRSDAITVNNAISGTGGLKQSGAGSLVLSGGNTYSGATTVEAGALIVNGTHSGGGAYTVQNTATLAGAGAISGPSAAVSLSAGGNLAPGNNASTGNAGTLTVPSLAVAGNGTAWFDLSADPVAGANDRAVVGGDLTLQGTTTVSVNRTAGYLSVGSYTLFTYGGSLTQSATPLQLAAGTLTGRQEGVFNYDTTGKKITLDISGAPLTLTWTGDASNLWDHNKLNKVWTNSLGSPDFFADADRVTFDESGSNVPSIMLAGSLAPASLAVTGAKDYAFSGDGKITGATGLVKSGTGVLTLANTGGNDFTGPVAIQNGTLALGADSALGPAASVTLGTSSTSGKLDLGGYSQQLASLAIDPAAVPAS